MEINEICDNLINEFRSKCSKTFDQSWKQSYLYPILSMQIEYNKESCNKFSNILNGLFSDYTQSNKVNDFPFIPVRLFKHLELRNNNEIFRQINSSGTSGANVSKIYIDKQTAQRQTKVLVSLTSDIIGSKRRPMVIFDNNSTRESRETFSARAAGIGGFTNFGRKPHFCLNTKLEFDFDSTQNYISYYPDIPILGFGFTFLIWQNVLQSLISSKKTLKIEKSSVLIHGGGWKKLEHLKVSRNEFNETISKVLGFDKIINYYGMVEQVGSVFFECSQGYFHAPFTSEVIIRCTKTFKPLPFGEEGLIQLLSIVPSSYPGNSLLTEDIGVCHGEDSCLCGLPGRYFSVIGRKQNAEVRGCSDVLS